MRGSRVRRCQPCDGRGAGQNSRGAARQNRHVSDVADRASGFRSWRVGMPEGGAQSDEQDRGQCSAESCSVKPANVMTAVVHYQSRTTTAWMLTQSPAPGKPSGWAVLPQAAWC